MPVACYGDASVPRHPDWGIQTGMEVAHQGHVSRYFATIDIFHISACLLRCGSAVRGCNGVGPDRPFNGAADQSAG